MIVKIHRAMENADYVDPVIREREKDHMLAVTGRAAVDGQVVSKRMNFRMDANLFQFSPKFSEINDFLFHSPMMKRIV